MFQIEDINKQTARKLKIDVKLVATVNDKQWKSLVYSLNHVEAMEVKMVYLGTFIPRYVVVKKRIRHLINAIRMEQKRESTPAIDGIIISLKSELKNIWKIKNEFAIKNVKAKLKKQNRQHGK